MAPQFWVYESANCCIGIVTLRLCVPKTSSDDEYGYGLVKFLGPAPAPVAIFVVQSTSKSNDLQLNSLRKRTGNYLGGTGEFRGDVLKYIAGNSAAYFHGYRSALW